MLDIYEVNNLTPGEVHRKLAYLQHKIWLEQYKENFFIKDPRPEFYLRYEIRAYWEGYIKEFHGWTNPIGQVAEWVVDKVKELLNWFWNNVFEPGIRAIISAFSWVWDKIRDTVISIWDWVKSVYQRVVEVYSYVFYTLNSFVNEAFDWIRSGWSVIVNKVREVLNVVYDWLKEVASEVVERIVQQLKTYYELYKAIVNAAIQGLSNLIQKIHESVDSAWHSLTEFISGKLETITKAMAALPQSIAAAFKSAISYLGDILKSVWDNVIVPIGQKVKGALEWVANKLKELFSSIIDSFRNVLTSIAPITPEKAFSTGLNLLAISALAAGGVLAGMEVFDLLHPFKNIIPDTLKAMVYKIANYETLVGIMSGLMLGIAIETPLRHYYNSIFRTSILSWGDVMELRSRGRISDEEFLKFMRYYGYRDEYKKYFDELANTPLSYSALRYMAQYGIWDPEFFREEISRIGWSQKAQEYMFQMYERLVNEPARGAYSSYIINRYIIGITTRDQLRQEAAMLGYTMGQIKQIVMGADLREDYEYVRDMISAYISAYRKGLLTIDQLKAKLAGLGLRPEKVQQYIDIELARQGDTVLQTQQEEVRAYGRSTVIKRYKEGMIDDIEFENELRLLGYSDQWIQRLKIVAQLERDYDYASEVLSTARTAYYKGLIGDEYFISILKKYGFTDEKIKLELTLLKLKKGLLPEEEVA